MGPSLELLGASLELLGASLELVGASLELRGATLELRTAVVALLVVVSFFAVRRQGWKAVKQARIEGRFTERPRVRTEVLCSTSP